MNAAQRRKAERLAERLMDSGQVMRIAGTTTRGRIVGFDHYAPNIVVLRLDTPVQRKLRVDVSMHNLRKA
jgi:hypothetical protein